MGPGCLGNPAAVAVVEAFPSDMARLARDNGLPATVFVLPLPSGEHHLRWFTPDESDFCGHGTLAATQVLCADGDTVRYQSRAGALSASKRDGWVTLDLPALPLTPIAPSLDLGARVLGVHDAGGRLLAELEDEDTVRALRPDFTLLPQSVIVTARARAPYDFVSRYFRKDGEDPVTGSAHCALAPFWSARLNKAELTAYQASARGGLLRVQHRGPRVSVLGQAITR